MERLYPKCCLSCSHRLEVYIALLNTLEQFFDLTPDEDDRVDALVIHGVAVELLKECGIVNQGYNLLASALTYAVLDQTLLQNLKGHLYPKVAIAHHTSAISAHQSRELGPEVIPVCYQSILATLSCLLKASPPIYSFCL